MDATYFCVNCNSVMNLDKHGRCSRCSSDAVDVAVRPAVSAQGLASAYLTVEDLEKLYEESQ